QNAIDISTSLAFSEPNFKPALIIAIASIFAAPIGARVGKRINQKALQYMLSILIVGTAVKMWIDMISK
ncbi:TSUP family transporter, partial [Bacillus sp. D-CC]